MKLFGKAHRRKEQAKRAIRIVTKARLARLPMIQAEEAMRKLSR